MDLDDANSVAIIGLSGRFPDANNIDQFWRNLRDGVDSVHVVSDEELAAAGVDSATIADKNYVKASSMLTGFEMFDAEFFGMAAREAEIMDPQQRLFLECSWEALEHAGYSPRTYAGAIGVYAGSSISTYLFENIVTNPHIVAAYGARPIMVVNDKDFLCGRVAYELNLRGPAVAVQTACSTSLVAVHMACQSILNGECDMALAGGVTVSSLVKTGYMYAEGGLNSRDGHCRAFDAAATGIVNGNGVGIVVLKSLAAARRDGDTVHAIVRGSAINNDGRGKLSFAAPSVNGQADVIADAHAAAGVDPRSISYIEAHGTGTLVGDPIEVGALKQAFGAATSATQFCALGSLKSNMGHLDSAAGVAGLIKTVLSLKHKQIPASLHCTSPNPLIDFANSPFFVNTALRDWPSGAQARRAGVSSFGVGGTNAHVVLEEAMPVAPSACAAAAQVLLLSARSAAALDEAGAKLAAFLEENPDTNLADAAHTLQCGREQFNHRRAVACTNVASALAQLRAPAAGMALSPAAMSANAPVVFMFPGGGTQYVNMGRSLYQDAPVFRAVIDECAAILAPILGVDVRTVLFPEQTGDCALEQMPLALPALFSVEYALARQFGAWGVHPAAMVGHSLGEYVAACCAGVFSLADALKVVAARGRLIATLPGANMVAVLAPAAQMAERLGDGMWLACVNSAQSCTIAATPQASAELARQLTADGIEFQLLSNWPGSHSGLMEPILEQFRAVLAGVALSSPRVPYLSNLSGTWVTQAQACDPEYWVAHLRHTVRFADCVAELLKKPECVFLEIGPGTTLTNLLRRDIPPGQVVAALSTIPRRDSGACSTQAVLHALGQLWTNGCAIDWNAFHGHQQRRRIALPTYAFQKKRYWIAAGAQAGAAASQAAPLGELQTYGALDQQCTDAPRAPSHGHARPALPTPFVAASSPAQQTLCEIWKSILGFDQVGVHDDFFALGGTSLIAIQLGCRIRSAFSVEIPLRTLFSASTVAAQAEAVAQARGGAASVCQIAPRAAGAIAAPSFAQQRLLFIDQLDAGASAAYHISKALRIEGDLDQAALRAALDRIVARHENLRTSFPVVDGAARQHIAAPDCGFALNMHDLRHLPGNEQQSALQMAIVDEGCQPFDLADGPLIRASLLRLGEQEHVLLITQHHIVSDGWSLGVLVRELNTLYAAFSQGQSDPLAPLALQYADYALWQRNWLQGQVLDAHTAYWKEQLGGAPALLTLPTDRARPAMQSYVGAHHEMALPPALCAGLRALSQRHGTTMFMTLLAGWALLLSRMAGQQDVVVGSPVANRQRTELEDMTGFFVNTLAFRVQLDTDLNVAQLLAQVKSVTLGAYEHQDLPFDQVVDALEPVRSTSYGPLFQAMINVHNTPGDSALAASGLRFSPVETLENTVQCDLVLSLSIDAHSIAGSLNYACELFDAPTVARMSAHLATVFEAMVADDQQRLALLPLLDAQQRAQVLFGFNDNGADMPRQALVHELFEQRALDQADEVALASDGAQVGFDQLNRRANQLAHHLRALGMKPDDRVGICLERGIDMVVAMLAILKAGGCYVPLDPACPPERFTYILGDSAPVALVTRAELAAAMAVPALPLVLVDADAEAIGACSDGNPDRLAALDANSLAYVIYTSGSTGQPKGVMVEHRNVVNLALNQAVIAVRRGERIAHGASPAFDAATWEIWGALLCGAQVVIVAPATMLDPALLRKKLVDSGVSGMFLTSALLNQFAGLMPEIMSSLKYVLFGGEKLDLTRLLAAMGQCGPQTLVHCYGPTETTTFSTSYTVPKGLPADANSLPIGRALANAQVYVLDAQLQPVPVGVTGEIYIGGAGVGRGYLNQEAMTAERFVADPFSAIQGARMYKSGDLGRWLADGNIDYVGRNDFQVKIRGFRIELGEIETNLAACAGVREAVVLARAGANGDKQLVAYVRAELGATLDAAHLRAQLGTILPEYMVPGAFVMMDEFPLTFNGKIDREALPAPDGAALAHRQYEAPQGEIELALAAIWCELLVLDKVGRNDHFFELGGHSLMVSQFVARVRDTLGATIALVTVFQRPTIALLAETVVLAELERFSQEEANALALDIENMTDEEVERMLAQEHALLTQA
ncbi:MAG: amino acid adenylation domain-containing protein [Pseudomonadota bacterium]